MAGCRSFALLLVLAAAATSVHAETFKWVDENGRINYSNNPPPAGKAAKAVQKVEDRISIYQTDPALKRAARNYRQPDTAEGEWLQRQRLMAMRAGYAACPSPYRSDCPYDGYRSSSYYPYVVYPVLRPTFFTASFPRPHSAGSRSARSSFR
jgi:hypothetical protein